MGWDIIVFKDTQEKDILNSFSKTLDRATTAKTTRLISVLWEKGPFLYMPYSKKITTNIHELRIRGKQEIRIFYTFKGNTIYLLHIFQKKTQKTPRRGIETAKERLKRLTWHKQSL